MNINVNEITLEEIEQNLKHFDEEEEEERDIDLEGEGGRLVGDFGGHRFRDNYTNLMSKIDEDKDESLEGELHGWKYGGEMGEDLSYVSFTESMIKPYDTEWEEDSISSEVSEIVKDFEEETEEEKELKKEKERLKEECKKKIMDRLILRRKNLYLQKKLAEHFKRRRMDNVLREEPKGLDLERKYLKKLYIFQDIKKVQENEVNELTVLMEKYEEEAKEMEERLDEKLKGYVTRAKEVSLNLISTKTGKRINDKVVDRLLRRLVHKCEEKGKKRFICIKIKNLIEEKELQLKSMEFSGEKLHIADYEQMKIDNQNYTDKIEEKEDELTKMRYKTQTLIQNLTNVKEKSYAIEGDIELMREKVYDVDKKFIEARQSLTKARIKRDSTREELARLKSTSGLLTRDSLLRDFEESISEAKNLNKTLEKIKKLIHDKKKQETELAKLMKSQSTHDSPMFEFKLRSNPRF